MKENIKENIMKLIERIRLKDTSVWIKDDEIENRIDWIDLDSKKVLQNIKKKLENLGDYENVVLLGMGGSSLAAMVFTTIYPKNKNIYILDTLNPDQIKLTMDNISSSKNVFIVSSKSGTTLETKVLYEYFRNNFSDDVFIFITDKDSVMDELARNLGGVVFNPNPNIGGRYSAFTEFGLVPSYLAGNNVENIVKDFEDVKSNLHNFINEKFYEIYELEKIVNDFYYVFFEYEEKDFVLGLWLEQLIAESTGKNNKGILPVVYKNLSFKNVDHRKILAKFKLSRFIEDLPKWMYIWFLYTACAASLLKVNPFNQPDVQLSKNVTNQIIASEDVNVKDYYEIARKNNLKERILEYARNYREVLYVAIQFYSSFDRFDLVEDIRKVLVEETGNIVVWGFGPRYLHSVGQLYKGGPSEALFIQIIIEPTNNLGKINKYFISQALGDLLTMKNLSRNIKGFFVRL
ncbi:MAG: hypothetical protein ACK4GJ_01410 [bacterium]